MKKIFAIMTLCALLSVTVFGTGTNEKNWYFSSQSKNERSVLPEVNKNHAIGIGPDEKVIFLTFDAGYENGNVAKIVDILKNNDVTGSFFVLKHFVEKNTDLTKKIKENGNLVCNHTSTHKNISILSGEELKEEITGLEKIYKETTGYDIDKFFRPPEGKYTDEKLEKISELGYKTVFWSLAYADWDNDNQKTHEYALNKLNSRVHNGAIILLHPTSKTNAEILDEFIKNMKNKGYRFGNLNEI